MITKDGLRSRVENFKPITIRWESTYSGRRYVFIDEENYINIGKCRGEFVSVSFGGVKLDIPEEDRHTYIKGLFNKYIDHLVLHHGFFDMRPKEDRGYTLTEFMECRLDKVTEDKLELITIEHTKLQQVIDIIHSRGLESIESCKFRVKGTNVIVEIAEVSPYTAEYGKPNRFNLPLRSIWLRFNGKDVDITDERYKMHELISEHCEVEGWYNGLLVEIGGGE